jgi:hypothetical protein
MLYVLLCQLRPGQTAKQTPGAETARINSLEKKIGHSGLGLSIITQSLDYAGSGLDNLLSS